MISTFGEGGVVDLKKGAVFGKGQQIDLETGEIGLHSTPTIVKDTVIVGSSFKEGMTVKTHNNTKGLVRAFDVKTGKLLWTFNTIPEAGRVRQRHVGERVVGDQRQHRRVDADHGRRGSRPRLPAGRIADLGLLRRPSSRQQPVSARASCAVDLKTGQRKWHFQIVHHPIWDYDLSSAPILLDINVNGKAIKAVALPSKEAFLYVFDRITGVPVWPIEERPVPQSDVPGEKTSPTQPFPTKPPAYARQSVGLNDLIDFTPELNAEAQEDRGALQAGTDVPAGRGQQDGRPDRGADDRARRRAAPTGRARQRIRKRTWCSRMRAITRWRRSASSNRRQASRTSATWRAPLVSRSSNVKVQDSAARRTPSSVPRPRPTPPPAAGAAPAPAAPERRLDGPGTAAPQTAVRHPQRDRRRQGRDQVAGTARRYA